MRRDYDGFNDEAMVSPTATECRELISDANFDLDGAVFWLRYIIIRNSSAAVDGILEVYDQDEAVAVAANKRFEFDVPASTTTVLELPAPGISFKVNITAGLTTNLGTVAAYAIHAGGYLVGGIGPT